MPPRALRVMMVMSSITSRLAMHVQSLIVKHALFPPKAQSAQLARRIYSSGRVLELQPTLAVCVVKIAMHVLQQMFAPRARLVIRKLQDLVLRARPGVRHAALLVIIARLA
jgi:hypothetical protein